MTLALNLQVRQATPRDQQSLSSLLFYSTHTHRHLDWRPPLDWLGSPFFWVMEEGAHLAATLACPPDPQGVAWLRLFSHSGNISALTAWQTLWETARLALTDHGGATVGVISTQPWMRPLLLESGFIHTQSIAMLEWNGRPTLPPSLPRGMILRPMVGADLAAVTEVDADAFSPLWHISLDSMERAFGQAVLATVIESEQGVLAYQISTQGAVGAHLARLAVRKEAQGLGLGATLVGHLIGQVRRRGLERLSVNTQTDNSTSLALYQKMGFARTGEEFPVYRYEIQGG